MDQQSALYNVIPPVLQGRLPRMPSLRSTLSGPFKVARRRSPGSSQESSSVESDSRPSSAESMSHVSAFAKNVNTSDGWTVADGSETQWDSQSVSWTQATQGIAMLRLSFEQRAVETSSDTGVANSARSPPLNLSRNLFVHGLTYLLRALPSNLTLDERESIQAALPDSISPLRKSPPQPIVIISNNSPAQSSPTQPPSRQRVLQRVTATVTLNAILVFTLLVPYLLALFRAAMAYEQRHQLSQKTYNAVVLLFQAAAMQTREFGRRSLRAGRQICSSPENAWVGKLVEDVASGVCTGFAQGIGDGVERLGLSYVPRPSIIADVKTRSFDQWTFGESSPSSNLTSM